MAILVEQELIATQAHAYSVTLVVPKYASKEILCAFTSRKQLTDAEVSIATRTVNALVKIALLCTAPSTELIELKLMTL